MRSVSLLDYWSDKSKYFEQARINMKLEKDMMKIVEKYVKGLKKAYYDNEGKESWNYFERAMHGAINEDTVE